MRKLMLNIGQAIKKSLQKSINFNLKWIQQRNLLPTQKVQVTKMKLRVQKKSLLASIKKWPSLKKKLS